MTWLTRSATEPWRGARAGYPPRPRVEWRTAPSSTPRDHDPFDPIDRSVRPLLAIASSPTPAEQAWPGFRGDGTGRARLALDPAEGPVGLALRWKRPLGSGYAGLSVAEGRLVTVARDGAEDVVVALDPATGQEHWRRPLAPVYVGHDGSADGGIATPAIADGRIFALSPWGRLAAYSLATASRCGISTPSFSNSTS